MSTTFEIIPTATIDITFGQVIELGEKNINDFLRSIGIAIPIQLDARLIRNQEWVPNGFEMNNRFEWKEKEYVWFYIKGIDGGTDAYCKTIKDNYIDPDNPWWFLKEIEENNTAIENIHKKLDQAKSFDRYWNFRRSAGQPGIIAASYGLISAAVAELTSGILYSDDGAWDFDRFPAESKDFLSWYFRPEVASKKSFADWAERCINQIKQDLKEGSQNF